MVLLSFFNAEGSLEVGIKTADGILATGMAASDLASGGQTALSQLSEIESDGRAMLDEGDLRLGPPVPGHGKIICVGLNYLTHARESEMTPPTVPVLFSKYGNSIAASGMAVALPRTAREYDYEAELVVVIGKRAHDVSPRDALDYVLGYCNGNDLSARDLQMVTSQWLLGKTLDGFLPLGPYLVTADEIPDPQELEIRCWLNGDLRQNATTADMIFPVAEIISYLSRYMSLEPGDIIATGTPEGVILGRKDRIWLKAGDTVVVEVGGLGRLSNELVAG